MLLSKLPSFFATEKSQKKKKSIRKLIFVIYGDLECLIEKIDGCKNNPPNSFKIEVYHNFPSGFSMSTILFFKSIQNKHDLYRRKNSMENICESLREHAMEIINFEKKKWSS